MPGPNALQSFGDYEKEQAQLLKHLNAKDRESVNCPNCDSQWFTELKVAKYKADHHVIVGQSVPPSSHIEYVLLKCLRCDDLLEPRILHNTRDVAGGYYDDLLDTLEGKGDKRQETSSGQIPSQRI